jgi:endonuclease III
MPMASTSKAQLLNEVHSLLKKRYKPEPRTTRPTVLEAIVYGICHEGTTREQANQALSRFKDGFYDWNEVRVSSLDEIQGVLAGLPDPEGRAQRIRRFLRQLFEKTYGFTLEALLKKPLKDAIKALEEYEALASDYVLATVIQQALGGHAIPVDAPIRRALERLGVADPGTDGATLRAALERAVPKNRGGEFVDLMEELAHDTCVEGEPDCPRCELKKVCPTGQARLSEPRTAAKVESPAPAGDGARVSKKPPAASADPTMQASARPGKSKSPRPK